MNPTDLKTIFEGLRTEANKVLVGLEEPFELLAVALFTGGHVLLEGVPGTAKTLMAKTLAHMVQAKFTRIQFTPDLMPSDILGTSVFDVSTTRFHLKKGPIFTQLLLADEINRAPPRPSPRCWRRWKRGRSISKVNGMQLDAPFMVIATQNPIEYEGTYPLPEAQLDRFMFKVLVPYSPLDDEVEVLRRYHHGFDAHDLQAAGLKPVLSCRAGGGNTRDHQTDRRRRWHPHLCCQDRCGKPAIAGYCAGRQHARDDACSAGCQDLRRPAGSQLRHAG